MQLDTIATLISSVGFPIVACCGMYYALIQNSKLHKDEMDSLKQSINENTIAITKLCERIGGEEK